MKQYSKHLAFAFRLMVKTPAITALSILVLSVSIAIVTVMFNTIDSVLMTSLPYEGGDRLMRVMRVNPKNPHADSGLSFKTYHQFLEQERVFDGTIAFFVDSVNLQTGLKHTQVLGGYVSTDFLEVLGVQPMMGRAFTPEDARADAPPSMLISKKVWEDYFAGEPDVIGRTLMADGISRTIIGVMPLGFDFPFVNDAWLPLNTDTLVASTGWGSSVTFLGRLNKEVSFETANEQVNQAFTRIKEELAVENEGFESMRLQYFKEMFVGKETRMLFLAMALCAGLVLFMGCAIASNLITVRSAKRSNELAIRSALGASRKQIVFQMLFESMISSTISLGLGWLLMEWFSMSVLQKYYMKFNVPSWFFVEGYSIRHFVFVVFVLLIVTIVSTLVPALRASKTSLNDLLKDSSRTGSSLKITLLGRLLIIFQISAACAVVTGGAIVGYYIHDLNSQNTDYDSNQYLYAQLGMDANTHADPKTRVQLMKNLKRTLESHSEVLGVTYSTEFYAGSLVTTIRKADEDYASPDAYPKLYSRVVSPGYFEVMNYSMITGRAFNEVDDVEHPGVIIVTDLMAEQFFGSENPLGKQLILSDDGEETVTIIGVVKDLFRADRDRDNRTGFFRSSYQEAWFDFGIHIHTSGNPRNIEHFLIQSIGEIDSRAVITEVNTIQERIESSQLSLTFMFILFMTFAIGALLMAGAGLYGVVSFSVGQRIREIGIRLALGAAPMQIILRVFRQGLVNVAIGVILGAIVAYFLRYILMMILNPLAESIMVYFCVLLSILFISSISMLIPAIKGGTTDPAEALRID